MERSVFGRTTQKIINFIQKHPGCTMQEILDEVYGKGQGNRGRVRQLLSQANVQLRRMGMKVVTRSGSGNVYRLVRIKS